MDKQFVSLGDTCENAVFKDYLVEVTENLSRTYVVRATSREDAIAQIEDAHRDEKVILSGDDCNDVSVFISPYATEAGTIPADVDMEECGYLRLEV